MLNIMNPASLQSTLHCPGIIPTMEMVELGVRKRVEAWIHASWMTPTLVCPIRPENVAKSVGVIAISNELSGGTSRTHEFYIGLPE